MTNQLYEVELAAKIDQVNGVHGVLVEKCGDFKVVQLCVGKEILLLLL